MGYRLGESTVQQYFDVNGDPLAGGTIEFFIWNTSTPTAVYEDDSGTSAGTSVSLNSIGAPENAGGTAIALFFDTDVIYKIIRKDASGTPIAPTIGPYAGDGGLDAIPLGGTVAGEEITGILVWEDSFNARQWSIGEESIFHDSLCRHSPENAPPNSHSNVSFPYVVHLPWVGIYCLVHSFHHW